MIEKDKLNKWTSYKFIQITECPSRRYRKGSMYDFVLDDFINSDFKIVKIDSEKKFKNYGNYLRTQLQKRIISRNLNVIAKVINGEVYLERKVY